MSRAGARGRAGGLALLAWGLVAAGTAGLTGCGSCGQGSSAASDEPAASAGPAVVAIPSGVDGGKPIRLRPNLRVIHPEAAPPP